MTGATDAPRDLSSLVAPAAGSLVSTGEVFEPYRLVDADGVVVGAVTAFLRDLQACGRSASTLRSYGMDLLRWFRFVWAVEIRWDRCGGSWWEDLLMDAVRDAMLASLSAQRRHVLGIVEGLTDAHMRKPVLPTGWSCIGLVQHLAIDVERFWFRAVMAERTSGLVESGTT